MDLVVPRVGEVTKEDTPFTILKFGASALDHST
jgi:hypothetical protein